MSDDGGYLGPAAARTTQAPGQTSPAKLGLPLDPLATTPARALALERFASFPSASRFCFQLEHEVTSESAGPCLLPGKPLSAHPRQPDIQASSPGCFLDAFLAVLSLAWASWFWVQQIVPRLTNTPQCVPPACIWHSSPHPTPQSPRPSSTIILYTSPPAWPGPGPGVGGCPPLHHTPRAPVTLCPGLFYRCLCPLS